MSASREKLELPFATAAEIEAAVAQFDDCSLSHIHWTHRAHLAVALVYSRRHEYAEALERLRERINAYNRSSGQTDVYNETVTVLFLRKIHSEQRSSNTVANLSEELTRLSSLCTIAWAYGYYSRERLWSEQAKTKFLPPDLRALDF